MKAVVMEIQGKHAVVLDRNGAFRKIPHDGHFRVGHEVEVRHSLLMRKALLARVSSVAAAVLLVIGVGYGAYSYSQPYSYVNMDINPSIEMTVNRFDRILKVEAVNAAGEQIIAKRSLTHRNLREGIEQLLQSAAAEGYFYDVEKNAVMFTVSGRDDEKVEQMQNRIRQMVSEETLLQEQNTDILVEQVTLEKHDHARKVGVSPGKLSLIERLAEIEPDVRVEALKDRPVKDIMENLIEGKKAVLEQNKQAVKEQKDEQKEEKKNGQKSETGNKTKKEEDVSAKGVSSGKGKEKQEAGAKAENKTGSTQKSEAVAGGKAIQSKKNAAQDRVKTVEEFLEDKAAAGNAKPQKKQVQGIKDKTGENDKGQKNPTRSADQEKEQKNDKAVGKAKNK